MDLPRFCGVGHAGIATTMIYVHHVPQHDAAAKLSAAVAQTAGRGDLGVDPATLGASAEDRRPEL